jgi:tRNA-2-methylthio-N6-dimethylallyladenosine synthase
MAGAGKRVYIKTFGCQMNEHDSEQMLALLAVHGYRGATCPEEADVILVNTCTVREKPEQKVYSIMGRLHQLKRDNPRAIVGITGCMAEQRGEGLWEHMPSLDFVLGPGKIHRLPEVLHAVGTRGDGVCATGFEDSPFVHLPLPQSCRVRASVTIMQGCNNFCSYCIVPAVRGRERSRPSEDILTEITSLVEQGTKEILLLGQNVNAYAKHDPSELTFPELLAKINAIVGLERIRFTTSHPKDLTEETISSFGHLSRLCEHCHLPFQAGSNAVLERMNRRHTREDYLALVQRLRKVVPHLSITADVMVGFPGESEADFSQTMELIQIVEFDALFSFKYSTRAGTRAAQWLDDVAPAVKQNRLERLQALQREITLKKNRRLAGEIKEVLVEGYSRHVPNQIMGRTRCNRIVNFAGERDIMEKIVQVRITEGLQNSLRGEPC